MITAAEAKKLSGERVEELALSFEDAIKAAAKEKFRQVTVHNNQLENAAYSGHRQWFEFVDYMKQLGFTVDFLYEERQFVNMGIIIKW